MSSPKRTLGRHFCVRLEAQGLGHGLVSISCPSWTCQGPNMYQLAMTDMSCSEPSWINLSVFTIYIYIFIYALFLIYAIYAGYLGIPYQHLPTSLLWWYLECQYKCIFWGGPKGLWDSISALIHRGDEMLFIHFSPPSPCLPCAHSADLALTGVCKTSEKSMSICGERFLLQQMPPPLVDPGETDAGMAGLADGAGSVFGVLAGGSWHLRGPTYRP